jgi:hypothetical protein
MALLKTDGELIDEMSIVDVLTKLIFDSDTALDDTEMMIVGLLRQIDSRLLGVSRRDVCEYLRSMGVDEMIDIVGLVKQHFDHQQRLMAVSNASPLRFLQH